jgi:hypothetical protein
MGVRFWCLREHWYMLVGSLFPPTRALTFSHILTFAEQKPAPKEKPKQSSKRRINKVAASEEWRLPLWPPCLGEP